MTLLTTFFPRSRRLGAALTRKLAARILGALCFSATAAISLADPFDFVALGDTAYDGPPDQATYRRLIDTINDSRPAFTIHVGDVWGAAVCDEARYAAVAETFARFDHALVYTPGDNEWTDCSLPVYGSWDSTGRLALLRRLFSAEPKSLGAKPIPLVRQSDVSDYAAYVENARWLYGDVLFFTMNVAGSHNNLRMDNPAALREVHDRNRANIAWLRDSFRLAMKHDFAGVVVAIHAEPFSGSDANDGIPVPYYATVRELRAAAGDYGKPILLIHGDAHQFIIDRPFLQSQGELELPLYGNITRLQVYGAPEIRAVRVSVEPQSPWLFSFSPLYDE